MDTKNIFPKDPEEEEKNKKEQALETLVSHLSIHTRCLTLALSLK